MLLLPAAIGTFIMVNLLCACAALGVGFAAGVWFFGARLAKPVKPTESAKQEKPQATTSATRERTAESAILAAQRVADVAQNIVGDVGDHAAKMQAISADLQGIDQKSSGATAELSAVVDKIMSANTELQKKLELAERQIATQAAEIKAHESEARTDALTGLNNRRAFDDELKRRLSEWERKGSPCTLILLDVDHFKKFNDTHGHQAGDEVLRQVAKTLKAQSRDMDLPCRYGGEEFAVILPATEAAGACTLAERIRKAIENSVTSFGGKSLKVTTSIGLSQLAPGDDIAKLIRRADDALYKSKEAGRNCGHWNTGERFVPITATADVSAAAATIRKAPPPATVSAPSDSGLGGAIELGGTRTANGTNFIHMLKRRVAESHRFGVPLSLMHLKIEDIDRAIQSHGRAMGRQLMDAAAPALEKCLREMDVIAPLEKGEFVVMLPGKSQAEAGQVAKRIRIAMDTCSVPLLNGELHIRVRHGIVELGPNETAQELLARGKQGLVGVGKAMPRSAVDA